MIFTYCGATGAHVFFCFFLIFYLLRIIVFFFVEIRLKKATQIITSWSGYVAKFFIIFIFFFIIIINIIMSFFIFVLSERPRRFKFIPSSLFFFFFYILIGHFASPTKTILITNRQRLIESTRRWLSKGEFMALSSHSITKKTHTRS